MKIKKKLLDRIKKRQQLISKRNIDNMASKLEKPEFSFGDIILIILIDIPFSIVQAFIGL